MSDLVDQLCNKLRTKKWKLVTAESCTGGMLATIITDKAGASEVFERGFVTYSNQSKIDCLGVNADMLEIKGAVSEHIAEEMAAGALKKSKAQVSISITGVAGPDGGTPQKPVGLVYIGYAIKGGVCQASRHNFEGTREEIRLQSIREAIKHLLSIIRTDAPPE